jgi:protein gp37
MSDLFQEGVPDDFIIQSFRVMLAADWHTYQVLTKRPERMESLINDRLPALHHSRHIWLGVSVEDKKHGLPRIKYLQQTQAAIRFLSIEPLLEDLGEIDLNGIHWVIVGGESGYGARPVKELWVNSILRQCRTMDVPFFFKQWGGVQKKRAGRTLNGKLYNEYPATESQHPPAYADRIQRLRSAQVQFA